MMRAVILVLALLSGAAAAAAQSAPDYRVTFEAAGPHLQAASGYLRTGNGDLGAIELEAFIDAWAPLADGLTPGAEKTAAQASLAAARGALEAVDKGALKDARAKVIAAREVLYDMHKATGRELFADCILAAVRQGEPLWGYRQQAPDLADAQQRQDVTAHARAYRTALEGCDGTASAEVRGDSEYRRLMDNALESLRALAAAVEARDDGLLYRYLIELRSLDRLLLFRFG